MPSRCINPRLLNEMLIKLHEMLGGKLMRGIRGIESLETEMGEERKAEVGWGFGAFLLLDIHTLLGERGRGGEGRCGI